MPREHFFRITDGVAVAYGKSERVGRENVRGGEGISAWVCWRRGGVDISVSECLLFPSNPELVSPQVRVASLTADPFFVDPRET